MKYLLRIIATVIIVVSMYQSSVWVAGTANNITTAVVLVAFVLALELAKAVFIILAARYLHECKWVSMGVYGVMALLLMSLSFCASYNNLSTWKASNSINTNAITALNQSLSINDSSLKIAQRAISAGYMSKGTKMLDNLTTKRTELLEQRSQLMLGKQVDNSSTTYMLIILSASVEVVSFLCLLALGNMSKPTDDIKPETKMVYVERVSDTKTKQVKKTTRVNNDVVAETKINSIPSIRTIKNQYHCGYGKAKQIQDEIASGTLSSTLTLVS